MTSLKEPSYQEIKKKAEACFQCVNKPCQKGCPLHNDIPGFIKSIKEDHLENAWKTLSETTIFEPICGRICPHLQQCQGSCIRGIKKESVAIGELETFLGDYALENIPFSAEKAKENACKVAIIGSGPAGLACAYALSSRGVKVDIYEKHAYLGGLLRYGIPEFRLDRKVLEKWLAKYICNTNVKVYTNVTLGKQIVLEELMKKYDKIILAFGANISNVLHIPGENHANVLGGNELLEYQNMPSFINKKVAVIGGGNVAMDTSRTIQKLGAKEVTVIYRRAQKQMPADRKEMEDAQKEGIQFLFQTNILQILDRTIREDALVKKPTQTKQGLTLQCIRTELIAQEGEAREVPVNIQGSEFLLEVDYLIRAVGSIPDKNILDQLGLQTNEKGYLQVNEQYQTSHPQIYAIGDLIGTKQTVAWAAKTGFDCAKAIWQAGVKSIA